LRSYGVAAVALCLSLAGCSANPPEDDDDDNEAGAGGSMPNGGAGPVGGAGMSGSTPTGGTSGSATGGSGGSSTQPIPGGPHPFPQGKTSGMCQITNHASAAQAVRTAYDYFIQQFVRQVSPGVVKVIRPTNSGDTVSEGIAYGMLAAVYMNDRALLDGLWAYAKAHFDSFGLMHWRLNADNTIASDGMGSASDADEDMAWALIMASAQWQSGQYLDDAKRVITAMSTHNIGADGMLLPGDGWGATDRTFPDYFSPAYFRVFATVSNNPNWSGAIINKNYEILAAVSGMYGLVPDSTTRTYVHMGEYGYDACRTPWRIAMDWCFNGEPRAKAYLDKIGPFFNGQLPVSNFGDRYSLTGTKTSNFGNMAFVGTAGVAGMAGWPNLMNEAFTYGATGTGGNAQYYQQALRLITMLMMSGNFLDYTKL
jgi:endoglucanase